MKCAKLGSTPQTHKKSKSKRITTKSFNEVVKQWETNYSVRWPQGRLAITEEYF